VRASAIKKKKSTNQERKRSTPAQEAGSGAEAEKESVKGTGPKGTGPKLKRPLWKLLWFSSRPRVFFRKLRRKRERRPLFVKERDRGTEQESISRLS
jgi:hypothetical protein